MLTEEALERHVGQIQDYLRKRGDLSTLDLAREFVSACSQREAAAAYKLQQRRPAPKAGSEMKARGLGLCCMFRICCQ